MRGRAFLFFFGLWAWLICLVLRWVNLALGAKGKGVCWEGLTWHVAHGVLGWLS